MRFPSTVSPQLFLMSPGARFVTFNSSLAVSSVLDRVSGNAATQTTAAAKPTWGGATIAGPYISANWPGVQGIAGLTFSGAQFLEYDALAGFPTVDGYNGLTIVCVASCTSPATGTQVIWSLGSSGGTTPVLSLQYNSSNIVLSEVNANGTFTATASIDANLHVITASRTAAGALAIRVDGLPVASGSVTMAGDAFNTFCIGAKNSNGSQSNYLTGAIGDISVYGAAPASSADVYQVEGFLMLATGLVRTDASI